MLGNVIYKKLKYNLTWKRGEWKTMYLYTGCNRSIW